MNKTPTSMLWRLRKLGYTFSDTGRIVGITGQAVQSRLKYKSKSVSPMVTQLDYMMAMLEYLVNKDGAAISDNILKELIENETNED